jgi:pyruvate dehydrogenase E1 component alpha subunit
VGAAFALRPTDWLVPAFRETGALLWRGIGIAQLLQFWSGDERGGKFSHELRTLPVAVPVGTHMLHAVGIGWALKASAEDAAALTIFGEGATSEGDFSEALNMAGVFRAPSEIPPVAASSAVPASRQRCARGSPAAAGPD